MTTLAILAFSFLSVSPTAPAAVPKVGTNDPTPAAGRAVRLGACGERNCLCVEGCVPGACVGGCNLAGRPDGRQWYALGGAYAGWHGFGRKLPGGAIAVDWSCRAGTTEVRRGLPALQPAPAYALPPQAFGACPGGQCPAPTYMHFRGHFGFR